MALPRPERPEYSTTLPSNNKKIKYQPFSVREEKALVLAAETKDNEEITNAVVNCIKRCVTSPQDFDVNELAIYDVEFLFLKLRAKSVGEKVELRITDPNDPTYTVDHAINVDKITVKKFDNHKNLIDISENTKVNLKDPDVSFFADGVDLSNIDASVQSVVRCMTQVIVEDEVYSRDDMTTEEMTEWVEGLTKSQFSKLLEFFATLPRLSHTISRTNPNTNQKFEIKLEGLVDFF